MDYTKPAHKMTAMERDLIMMEGLYKSAWLLTLKSVAAMMYGEGNRLEASMSKAHAGMAVTKISQKAVELALLRRGEGEKDMAGTGVDHRQPRADADRHVPVSVTVDLRHDHQHVAVIDDEMAGLLGLAREPAQHRHGLADQPVHRRPRMRQFEQLQRDLVAVASGAPHIGPPHQPVEHPVDFVGRAVQRLGDLGLAHALVGGGQQFDDVETFIEGGCPVLFKRWIVERHLHPLPRSSPE
ncbi:MAG: hypothetical protein V9G20_29735 [Candidatus Promineifilaceae bacterium]